ncbi:MAG: hypothetical protein JRJ80_03330 [Deltaproteobacteria bacterium]|jgi:hypothetical protein|nr:hypothetical protein [Deltaproteobacteria bacterium]MBW1906859.1 hypothetical protein [Deltaproteobacteria bacterium]
MRWTLFALPWLVLGCWGQTEEPPGEPVGTFKAVGFMVEQSCGAAVPAPDPLDLDFELRSESNGRAYWRKLGGAMFAGLEKDGEFTFQVSQSWMVLQPDRFRGYVGCSVTQRDVFTFVVETVEPSTEADGGVADGGVEDGGVADGGVDEESGADAGIEPTVLTLSGSQTTEIVPLTGSDCTPAVAALGGPFLSLPCRVEYVLSGEGVAINVE